jgi:hypothetical protein
MPTSYRQDRFLHVPLSEPVSEIASRNSLLLDEISLWLLQPPWPRPETLYKLHVDPAPGRPDPRRSQPPRTRGDTRSTTRVLIWTEQLRGPPGFREHTHLSGLLPIAMAVAKCVPTTQGCINGLDLAGYLLPSTPPPLARPLGPSAVLPGTAVSLDCPTAPVRDFGSSIPPYVADIHLFCSSCASSALRAFTLLLPRRTTLEPSF